MSRQVPAENLADILDFKNIGAARRGDPNACPLVVNVGRCLACQSWIVVDQVEKIPHSGSSYVVLGTRREVWAVTSFRQSPQIDINHLVVDRDSNGLQIGQDVVVQVEQSKVIGERHRRVEWRSGVRRGKQQGVRFHFDERACRGRTDQGIECRVSGVQVSFEFDSPVHAECAQQIEAKRRRRRKPGITRTVSQLQAISSPAGNNQAVVRVYGSDHILAGHVDPVH